MEMMKKVCDKEIIIFCHSDGSGSISAMMMTIMKSLSE
jgi:hypothetical protein